MKTKIIYSLLTMVILLATLDNSVAAADVYKPYLHNPILPDNPGIKIQGSFDTALWPGAGIYSYPIEVPPGTNSLTPSLSLTYNSHLTSNRPGLVGTAWLFSDNYIVRDTNYTFAQTSDDKFRLILDGQTYNLIYNSSDKRYHTEIESFLNIQNVSGGNNTKGIYWVVRDKDGTSYRLGYHNNSEMISNLYNFTVKWSLDLITDTHNNNVYYSYLENPYMNDFGAVYLNKIEYNNDRERVVQFIYENSDRPDKWLVYEDGNKVRESRRLKEIQINASENLVRKYVVNYTLFDSNGRSAISSITLFSNDGNSSLPSTFFRYYNVTKGWLEDNKFILPSLNLIFEQAGTDYGVRLLDFNRDGLEDITMIDGLNPTLNQSWVNNGSGWVRNDSWNVPDYIVDNLQRDTGLRFIDFNGDGFTDIVRGDGGTRKSWQNSMKGWVLNSTWNLPSDAHPVDRDSSIFERGVRFVDFNKDGRVDILSATDDWNRAWVNNGSGWTLDNSWNVPSAARFIIFPSGVDEGVRIEDVNGDNLPDLIKGKGNNNRTTWLNNGTNWIIDSSWTLPNGVFFVNLSGIDEGIRLADINGDGLIDILRGNAGNESTWVNNGSGWTLDNSWNVPERANFVSSYGTNKGVRIVDINGDGLVDLMDGGSGTPITYINKAKKAYLLKNITNNLGGINGIDYLESTKFDNTGQDDISDIGFNIWIVNTLFKENGMNNTQNINFTTHYQYKDGLYDYGDRDFRGFNKIDEIIQNISIITHMFNQSDSLKGQEYKTDIYDTNSKLYHSTERKFNVENNGGYYTIEIIKEIELLYDGSYEAPFVTETEYGYDDYGNIKVINNLGDNSTQGDERYEYLDYVYNTTAWIVEKPKKYTVYKSDNFTKIRETLYRYDNINYGDSPIKGDITRDEQWFNTDNSNITSEYSYDSHGNLIKETNPRGFNITYNYGMIDLTNTFIDRIINQKGHITNYLYDLGTGNLLSETDSNGFIKNYTYDNFGRIQKEIQPYDNSLYPTKEYIYNLDGFAPESVLIKLREKNDTNNTLDTYYFYDGLANLIQIKSEAENQKQSVVDFYYDVDKRVIKQNNPYFVTTKENYSEPNVSINFIGYKYDVLSRTTKVKNQDGTERNITFNREEITYVDEKANKKIYSLDAYDRIVKVIEYVGNNYFITNYEYNTVDNLLQINNSNKIITRFIYDSIGRKISQENIDSGNWSYVYDKNNNLVNQTNAKGINVSLEYDELDRLVKKTTSEGTIEYKYDKMINGTISSIITSASIINYSYDNRLRKIKEILNIDGKALIKEYNYDTLDRIISEKLPDNNIIIYNYSFNGLIEGMTNILNDVEYNSIREPTKLSYINNLDTDFVYNVSTFRLEKITTGNKQIFEYKYDVVGNLILINDTINNITESMMYDNLNRLLSSKRTLNGQSISMFNYTYGLLGKILKIVSGVENITYFYGSKPSHAPRIIIVKGLNKKTDLTKGNITEDGYIHKYSGFPPTYSRSNSGTTISIGASDSANTYRGYIQFNTSFIQDSATIENTLLNTSLYSIGSSSGCSINQIENKNLGSASNENLYNDIGNGTTYVSPACNQLNGTIDLGSNADTHLQNQLADNVFGIGIKWSSEGLPGTLMQVYSSDSANDPILIVTYNV